MIRQITNTLLFTLISHSTLAAELPPSPDPGSISTKVFPADEHRNVVVRTCAVCHPPELVVAEHRTADKWDEIIARMVNHGARASEEELDNIFQYLVTYFSNTGSSPQSTGK
jgi:hypothetical protein